MHPSKSGLFGCPPVPISQACCYVTGGLALWLPSETYGHTRTLRDREAVRAAGSLTYAVMGTVCTPLSHCTLS